MTRIARKYVTSLCLTALLFLQLAVAAHACQLPLTDDGAAGMAITSSMDRCQGMDQEQPKLCEQHAIANAQATDTQPHSYVFAPALPLLAFLAPAPLARKASSSRRSTAIVVDPPPLIRFGVLRI